MTIDNVPMLEVPEEILEPESLVLRGRVDMYIDFEIDIRAMREKMGEEAWKSYSLEKGYQEWERGIVIAWDQIADNVDFSLFGPDYIKTKWSDIEEIDFTPRWSKQLADELEPTPKGNAATVEKAAN